MGMDCPPSTQYGHSMMSVIEMPAACATVRCALETHSRLRRTSSAAAGSFSRIADSQSRLSSSGSCDGMATPLATGLESIVPGDGSASAKLRQHRGMLRRFGGSVGSHVANCREFRADPCRCVAPHRLASLLLQTVGTPRCIVNFRATITGRSCSGESRQRRALPHP
jgi:hypothetical protein